MLVQGQAFIWTSVSLLLIVPLGITFSDILINVKKISLKMMPLKMHTAKSQPFGSSFNVFR